MIFIISLYLALAHAGSDERPSIRLPAGLWNQLPAIADRPLMGNPVMIMRQFMPPGSYRVRRETGAIDQVTISDNVLSYVVGLSHARGTLLRIEHGYWNWQGDGVIFKSGQTMLERDGDGWAFTYVFRHSSPPPEWWFRKYGSVPEFIELKILINSQRKLASISWDASYFNKPRNQGRLLLLNQPPSPNPRCALLLTRAYGEHDAPAQNGRNIISEHKI